MADWMWADIAGQGPQPEELRPAQEPGRDAARAALAPALADHRRARPRRARLQRHPGRELQRVACRVLRVAWFERLDAAAACAQRRRVPGHRQPGGLARHERELRGARQAVVLRRRRGRGRWERAREGGHGARVVRCGPRWGRDEHGGRRGDGVRVRLGRCRDWRLLTLGMQKLRSACTDLSLSGLRVSFDCQKTGNIDGFSRAFRSYNSSFPLSLSVYHHARPPCKNCTSPRPCCNIHTNSHRVPLPPHTSPFLCLPSNARPHRCVSLPLPLTSSLFSIVLFR